MLADPDTPTSAAEQMEVQAAAKTIGQQLINLDAGSDAGIDLDGGSLNLDAGLDAGDDAGVDAGTVMLDAGLP